ncbi:MAG: gamma-glutamyltransferase, partial [Chloroflexota bacterium]
GPHGKLGEAHRPVASGRNGMACAGHPLAAEAGVAILRAGGTAVDAALAVAAALNVVEPNMSGIGGDGFIMVYDASQRQIQVMNATGPAPRRATRETYLPDGIPMKGIRSVSVPGLVSGWLQVHARYGRRRLAEVFGPAIDLAARGFPISQKLATALADEPAFRQFPSSGAIFTRHGEPLDAGDLLVQADLAESFQALAEEGEASFYQGRIARAIAECSTRYDGLLDEADLGAFHARWQDPIGVDYRGYSVFEAPPNSSGHVLLQMLNLVEPFDLAGLGPNCAESVHLMVEAKKLAFADREAYLADPDFVEVPIDGLLSKEYARERGRAIDPRRAAASVTAGDPWPHHRRIADTRLKTSPDREDTTCFAVVDRWGNAVCQLQSLQTGFGSGLVVPGTGILLNNRMTYWHLDPNHVDCLAPGKRVRHTMNPIIVLRDGRVVLVCGTPGADTQVQSNLQVLTHVLDRGYNVAEAVEAPRWRHLQDGTESTVPHACVDALRLEERFPADVRDALRALGHPVETIGPWAATGSMMMIQANPDTGALFGGADPRRDGYAIGW